MERTYIESDQASNSYAELGRYLTSTGWVVSGHLAEVGVVLYYNRSQVSIGSTSSLCAPSVFSSSQSTAIHIQGVRRTLRTEELSRDVQGFTSHNDNLLAVEQLLSHGTGQTTKEVTLAIDGDLLHVHVS